MSEWHGRDGAEKLAPPRPSLEEILRLADAWHCLAIGQDRPEAVESRLGLLPTQRDRFQKLLRGLTGVAASSLSLIDDCYIGGSFGRNTALNYHFDADVVVFIEDFDPSESEWYQQELCQALEDRFRRGVKCKRETPFSVKLRVGLSASGDFATVDMVTTGEPPDYMDARDRRFYSGADSWRVDEQIMNFAVRHREFRGLVLLVKHWRNLRFPPGTTRSTTSYHLELLCMEVIRESESKSLRDLFREFLEWVAYGDDNLLVKNPNRYHGDLRMSDQGNLEFQRMGKGGMDLLAAYAIETLNAYHRHIRPGNTAACPFCGERRFRSATGAVLVLLVQRVWALQRACAELAQALELFAKVLEQRTMFAPLAAGGPESLAHLPTPTPAVSSGKSLEDLGDLRLTFTPSLKAYSSTLGLGGDRSSNPLTYGYSSYDSFGYDRDYEPWHDYSYGYDGLSYDSYDSFGSYGLKAEHRRRFGDGFRRNTRFHEDSGLGDLDDRWSPWTGASAWDGWSLSRGRSRSELLRLAANRSKAFEEALSSIPSSLPFEEGEPSQKPIPRILHQTWKTDQVPAKFAHHLQSWRRLHPDWHFEFWDDHSSRELMAEKYPKHLRQYDRMSGIKRADIARLVALSVYGGVYADIDVEATRSLEPLLVAAEASDAAVLLGEENFVHSVLLDWGGVSEVLQEIFSKSWCGEDPVQCTGPRIVDQVSWEHLRRNSGCRKKGCVLRLPYDYFSPNIALWNAANMVKECRPRERPSSLNWLDPHLHKDSLKESRPSMVSDACRSLSRALEWPTALHSNRTYAVNLENPLLLYREGSNDAACSSRSELGERLPQIQELLAPYFKIFQLDAELLDCVMVAPNRQPPRHAFSCVRSFQDICFLGESDCSDLKDAAAVRPPLDWPRCGQGGRRAPSGSLSIALEAAEVLAQVLHKRAPISSYECFMQSVCRAGLHESRQKLEELSASAAAKALRVWRDLLQAEPDVLRASDEDLEVDFTEGGALSSWIPAEDAEEQLRDFATQSPGVAHPYLGCFDECNHSESLELDSHN
eukprot:s948_g24.t1